MGGIAGASESSGSPLFPDVIRYFRHVPRHSVLGVWDEKAGYQSWRHMLSSSASAHMQPSLGHINRWSSNAHIWILGKRPGSALPDRERKGRMTDIEPPRDTKRFGETMSQKAFTAETTARYVPPEASMPWVMAHKRERVCRNTEMHS